ncbi:MAG TPA: hypothetical protein VF796_31170, partial [Humisphaera sp.]
MRRRLFDLAALASLLVLAAVVVLWVRSYRTGDVVSRASGLADGHADVVEASSSYGSIGCAYRSTDFSPDRTADALRSGFGLLRPAGPRWAHFTDAATPTGVGSRHGLRPVLGFAADRTVRDGLLTLHARGATVYTPVRETWVRWQFPAWLPAAAAAALPVAWVAGHRRWRRREMVGRCRACGYDLRATPDR